MSVDDLCSRNFQRLGAFAVGLLLLLCVRVHGFPMLRLLRPIRRFLRYWSFVGVSLPYFPLSLTSFRKFPVFSMEDSSRNDGGGVFLPAPSTLCGSPVLTRGTRQVYPRYLLRGISSTSYRSLLPRFICGFRFYWLTSQARYVRGEVSRRAMHASRESPCHSSAKHHILRACLPRMAPFRAMLLTP